MTESYTLRAKDIDSDQEALVLVRAVDSVGIAIGLSLVENGDIEVVLTRFDANQLLGHLQSLLSGGSSTPG